MQSKCTMFLKERKDYLQEQKTLICQLLDKWVLTMKDFTTENIKDKYDTHLQAILDFKKWITQITPQDFEITTLRSWELQFDSVISLLQNGLKLQFQKLCIQNQDENLLPNKHKFSKESNIILKEWLYAHYSYPYPTIEETSKLAQKCHLTFKQIQIWFINSRGRIANKNYMQQQFKNIVKSRYFEMKNNNMGQNTRKIRRYS